MERSKGKTDTLHKIIIASSLQLKVEKQKHCVAFGLYDRNCKRDTVSKNEKPKELLVFLDSNKIIGRGSKKDTSANWKIKNDKNTLNKLHSFYEKHPNYTCSHVPIPGQIQRLGLWKRGGHFRVLKGKREKVMVSCRNSFSPRCTRPRLCPKSMTGPTILRICRCPHTCRDGAGLILPAGGVSAHNDVDGQRCFNRVGLVISPHVDGN